MPGFDGYNISGGTFRHGRAQSPFDFLASQQQQGPQYMDVGAQMMSGFGRQLAGVSSPRNVAFQQVDPTGRRIGPFLTMGAAQAASGRGGTNALSQMGAALRQDVMRQQEAADQQFGAQQQQAGMFEEMLGRRVPQIEELGQQQLNRMTGEANRIEAGAQSRLGGDIAFTDKVYGDTKRMAADSLRRAEQATGIARDVAENYQDRVAQDAQTIAGGLRNDMQNEMKRIGAGINPDGTMMTAEQRQASMQELRTFTSQRVDQALQPLFSRANEMKTQLESQVAQFKSQESSTAMQGAQTVGSTGASLAQTRVASTSQFNQSLQIGATMRQFGEQLRSAANLQAVNYEMQGRMAMAELATRPRGIISMYAGLSSLFAAHTAPGAQQVGALM